jgi:magnesium and cobalt transporter
MCKAGHSRVPVYEETVDHITGILYVKDLLKLLIESPRKKFQLNKISHEPYFVPETMTLDELLLGFKLRKLHLAVVVDEYGGVSGIVTLEDILEEIVGDINDEFDTVELPEIERIGNNSYEVDSRMPITDFNEQLGLKLTQDGFDTIGGYVFDLFGKIPEKGETIREGNIQFTIKEISGTVINRISVTIVKRK